MARHPSRKFGKLLVANRGEIAIRVMRAATELGIGTVSIFSNQDRVALHRFKADESYLVGADKGPVEAYLDIDDIVDVALSAEVDAVHPGYGFLSENPDFAEACGAAGLVFIGPDAEAMRRLGNKVAARALAVDAGVPVMPATAPLPEDIHEVLGLARQVGFPLMLKASWGGGGRGMREVEREDELADAVQSARSEARAAFGNDEVYLEKLVRHARHVEVQILADAHGNAVHLFERDCTVQRRHQKVIERAPAQFLSPEQRRTICDSALLIARAAGYRNAGTVEFLQDVDTGDLYFIEVNPRIQVEHTVTEEVTGIDIVKAQIRIAEGEKIGSPECGVPVQDDIALSGHAIQCRVTTENAEANFIPDHGRIETYRSASGFGIRLDAGTAYAGALILPHYDSLLVKVTSWGRTAEEAVSRMDRALREFRVRGIETNLRFLDAVITHPDFLAANYTTRFIDQTPELFTAVPLRDRATRLLAFIGDIIVNGNPEVAGFQRPRGAVTPRLAVRGGDDIRPGTRQRLEELGAAAFAEWVKREKRVLITDTTFRDAHQSLLATRVRSRDLLPAAPVYARGLPELFSIECWGGATFDVAMRFLKESPWERLESLRQSIPNVMLQMLLRASNAVGYTNYADNVVRYFVNQAADAGIDLFRIFDPLNWVENMHVAIDAVLETGKLCEASICFTGDLLKTPPGKYDLDYYLGLARELKASGTHILGVKDMAGVCRPEAARQLVRALKQETGLPVHFHTHDTSGIGAASVLAAIEAGADAVDAAMDTMSGLTSQPSLGSIVEALRHTPRDTGLDGEAIRTLCHYWEQVRRLYAPFESDLRAGASEIYLLEMPGGQYTNLRQQSAALGLAERWPDVARAYTEVNQMFGDVIKVTPMSKAVGDMALMMVSQNLTPDQVCDPDSQIAFPESVVSFFRGELGQPPGGFPQQLQNKVLAGETPLRVRPGEVMAPVDVEAARGELEKRINRRIDDRQLASYLLYPKVFVDFAGERRRYGDVSVLPTTAFFYGMEPGEEITASIERGKILVIRFLALGDTDERGEQTVFFELNGQPRAIKITDRSAIATRPARAKADAGNPNHVAAPMPGVVVAVSVESGQKVEAGDPLVMVEAMKVEAVVPAPRSAVVGEILVRTGDSVETGDLLIVFDENA